MSLPAATSELPSVHPHLAEQIRQLVTALRELIVRSRIGTSDIVSPYLTVTEAAAYCRVAVQTIYNRRSEIERVPAIRRLLFTRESLDKWLASRRRRRRQNPA